MKDAAALEALSTLWSARGLHPSQIQAREDGTLVASDRTQLLESSATLLVDDSTEAGAVALSPERLEMRELLGRGGMGDVHLAHQVSLRRDVAVKTVRHAGEPSAANALLKEAWVGGSLEHPNVVPVHTLARTSSGAAVVMKRVEGVSWTEILEDPDKHERFRAGDLDPHLDVLTAVCRAIELAHDRGILHLDLKPDNVMVGAFGEVYVLDWGLALGLDHGPAWLAHHKEVAGIAGTPAYMAPELAAADGASIGVATDVYLLGGVLHTVLTGEPLHAGRNVMQLLLKAYVSEPPVYGPDVPTELATIARRATARDPKERYPSVAAFREALRRFRDRQSADRLARAALAALDEATPLVEAAAGDGDVEPRFREIELAVESARRRWSAHPELPAASERLLELRARHALAHERPDAAGAFLSRMEAPPARLARELEALRGRVAHRERHHRHLEAMSRELDLTLGSAARRRVFAAFGALWLLFNVAFGWSTRTGVLGIGYRELILEGALLAAFLVTVGVVFRRALFQNVANRRLYGGLAFTAVAVELHWLVCTLLDVPVPIGVGLTSLYYTFAFATLAIVLDRRLLGAALCMAASAAAVAWAPAYVYEHLGIGGGAAVALTLALWRRAS